MEERGRSIINLLASRTMTEPADGEGAGDEHNHVPLLNEEGVHAQDGLSSSTEDDLDNIGDALNPLPAPRESQPPWRPPTFDASSSDLLMETWNLEANPHLLEAELKKISPEPVRIHIEFLRNQSGVQQQPQFRDLSSGWFRKTEAFVEKCRESCLTEVLFRETDIEFLHQLLDAIYSLDIDGALEALPKQSQPSQTPLALPASSSNLLVVEEDIEEALNLEANPALLKAELKKISPEPVRIRIEFLRNQRGGLQQPQFRDLSSGWFRKMEAFVTKCGESCLTEVLFRETDIEFLHQLLDAIYSLDTKRVDIPDPLVALPSVLHRERTKELFPRIEEL